MKEPKIAIIIINWNTFQLTFNCLKSLEACSYNNISFFLVDNGSIDGSGDKIALEFPEVNYIKNEKNEGFTGANNKALKVILKQNFEYVLLLNNDTEVNPNFLSLLEIRMKSDKNLAATQPLILDLPHKKTVWNAGGSFNTFLGLSKTRCKGVIYKPKLKIQTLTEWISGCCILVKIQAIKEVGLSTMSECILGLPGETFQSHVDTLRNLVRAKIDNIQVFTCMMLPGSELATPEERKKWNLETRFRILPRDFTKLKNGNVVLETEECVISSDTLSFEEYVELRILAFILWTTNVPVAYDAIKKLFSELGLDIFDLFFQILIPIKVTKQYVKNLLIN